MPPRESFSRIVHRLHVSFWCCRYYSCYYSTYPKTMSMASSQASQKKPPKKHEVRAQSVQISLSSATTSWRLDGTKIDISTMSRSLLWLFKPVTFSSPHNWFTIEGSSPPADSNVKNNINCSRCTSALHIWHPDIRNTHCSLPQQTTLLINMQVKWVEPQFFVD